MSRRRNTGSVSVLVAGIGLLLSLGLLAATASAQQETPKFDVFTGYQWVAPTAIGGNVPTPFQDPNAPVGEHIPGLNGFGASFTFNMDSHWGLEADLGQNWGSFGYMTTGSAGPRFMVRTEGVNLFLNGLVGYNRLSVSGDPASNGVGAILGGGMDLPISNRLSFRLFEADYMWSHHHFADIVAPSFPELRRPDLQGVRLRSGLVWNFGGAPQVPPAASCSVQPAEVMVGEPITATATASNFNPKHTLTYTWNATGGKVTGKDNTASIDTNGVAGGSYTVTARIADPKMKKGGEASCSANFTVKPPNPPTMSCSANPTTVQVGGTVSLTCSCSSPDNQTVTVSGWSATSGTVSGNGPNATLNTTGASPGQVTVSATCSDPRGLSTQASTQVTVQAPPPPPPPPPQASKLSECDFANMAKIKKPWRVDNECKGKLDDVGKNLQQSADNRLVIVGNAEPTEKRKNLAAERAVNAKAYLTGGEAKLGIDPGRIETRTGSAGTQTDEFWIVPAGATFSEEGTQPVDESKVKAVPDHPHPAAKKKAAPKAQ